jgi:hypothetical protein
MSVLILRHEPLLKLLILLFVTLLLLAFLPSAAG